MNNIKNRVSRFAILLLFIGMSVGCESEVPDDNASAVTTGGENSGTPSSPEDIAALTETQSVDVNGDSRSYILHVPAHSTGDSLPVVFNFHGFGSNAEQQQTVSEMSTLADTRGFIVVYPQGRVNALGNTYWSTLRSQDQQSELDFVEAMLARLQNEQAVDSKRLYVTGISNGGGMANMLAGEMADTFAAIAPVAGAYFDYSTYSPSQAVAVMAFHGIDDNVVPYTGSGLLPAIEEWSSFWAENNGCGTQPDAVVSTGEITERRWEGCENPVVLYSVDGKGHSWPGSVMNPSITTDEIDATQLMMDFFAAHSR